MGDFWQGAYSNILSNRNRSIFAEFIVGVVSHELINLAASIGSPNPLATISAPMRIPCSTKAAV